jgi:hypothetical protein
MDNRTVKSNNLDDKGEVTGMRPGSEIAQPEIQVKKPVKAKKEKVVLSEEEHELALINRPKPKNVTPLANQKLTPKDIPVFEQTPERIKKLEIRQKETFQEKAS